MTNFRLRYVKSYIDRHGKVRHYLRRPGRKPVALPGLPGSTEFMAAYSQGLAETTPRVEVGASRTAAGTVNAMVVGYMASAAFHNLASGSKQQYRRILEGLRREYGNLTIPTLKRKHIVMMLDAKAETPVAARDFLRCLRLLVQYAISIGVRADDPTAGVRVKLPKSDGYRTWTEDDIDAFEAAYPLGSKPRLALALLLGTAARCADVVRLGRGNVRGGTLQMTQQKTGVGLTIPITAVLAEAINAAAPSEAMVFLVNELGRARRRASANGLPRSVSASG
jgi:integrase